MEPDGVDGPVMHDQSPGAVEPATADVQDVIAWRAMTPAEQTAFKVLSASTAPVWLAMIVAPRSRFTERMVGVATPLAAALGVAYVGLLVSAAASGDGDPPRFDDPDSLRRGLASPTGFLAGWTHYLVFDLYVGRHIWSTAREHGRVDRLPLLLTWWAGPAGLTLHLARNARSRRASPERR